MNVFIALSQLSALSAGFVADWFLGNFHTQNVSNVLATIGIVLVMIFSWQFSISEPSCCANHTLSFGSSGVTSSDGGEYTSLHYSDTIGDHGNCSELKRHLIFGDAYATIPSSVTIMLILIGLGVRYRMVMSCLVVLIIWLHFGGTQWCINISCSYTENFFHLGKFWFRKMLISKFSN